MLREDQLGRIVKNPASTMSERETRVLDQYRGQARELQEALARLKDLQSQMASVTQQRQDVLGQRERLLDSFEDEFAVAELSKLGSRVEMCEAKLASLGAKLTGAEAELRGALATFAISFNALFLSLRIHLINASADRIRNMLHPSVRQISGASIAEVAALAEEVVDLEPRRIGIDPMASMPNNQLPPENIQRDAERALSRVEALLTAAEKLPGFTPPPAFSLAKWRADRPAVPVAA